MQNHCARKPTHRKEKRETEGDAAPIAIRVDVDIDIDLNINFCNGYKITGSVSLSLITHNS